MSAVARTWSSARGRTTTRVAGFSGAHDATNDGSNDDNKKNWASNKDPLGPLLLWWLIRVSVTC
jgi:hypothetical protein